jgi:hypothetical protein
MSRRGWVAGSNGLLSSPLATVGLANSAARAFSRFVET